MTPDHSQRAHSPFGPSSAHRFFRCPGSVRLCADAPDSESEYSREGTRAHEFLERVLKGDEAARGEMQPEMRDAVDVMVNYVRDLADGWPGAEITAERKYELPVRNAPKPVIGTCDVTVYVPELKCVWVPDYKHGAGVPVDIFTIEDGERKVNEQVRGYALAALDHNPQWDVTSVCVAIVQPRAHHADGPVREEWITVDDLVEFRDEYDQKIAAALAPDAPLVPGEKQCRFCPASPTCPARERQALAVIGSAFQSVRQVTVDALPDPQALTVERLAEIKSRSGMLRDWLNSVDGRALELAKGGTAIPGFKLVEATPRRHYLEDEEQACRQLEEWGLRLPVRNGVEFAISCGLSRITDERIPPEEFMPPQLLGVTEIDKMLADDARASAPKGKVKEAVKAAKEKFALLTTKKSSGALSLAPVSDPRPETRPGAVFDGVVNLPKIGQLTEDSGAE